MCSHEFEDVIYQHFKKKKKEFEDVIWFRSIIIYIDRGAARGSELSEYPRGFRKIDVGRLFSLFYWLKVRR